MVMLKQDASLFDVIITYNDTPGRAKPNPYPLQLAASRLGVSEARSILVGDTHQDVLAARNARMRCIAVLWGYETEASLSRYSPDHMVSSPAELADVLQHQDGAVA
jgi:phosphoglycolate phosphatase-like HAD superfamily hydrolase